MVEVMSYETRPLRETLPSRFRARRRWAHRSTVPCRLSTLVAVVLLALGVHLAIRTVAALYRVIDLWYIHRVLLSLFVIRYPPLRRRGG